MTASVRDQPPRVAAAPAPARYRRVLVTVVMVLSACLLSSCVLPSTEQDSGDNSTEQEVAFPSDLVTEGSVPLKPKALATKAEAALDKAGLSCDGVTPSVLAAQIEEQSKWNPDLKGKQGQQGLAQLTDAQWQTYGLDGDKDGKKDPFNPLDAIPALAAYDCALSAQIPATNSFATKAGPVAAMLAAYACSTSWALNTFGQPPQSCQDYAQKILGLITKYLKSDGG